MARLLSSARPFAPAVIDNLGKKLQVLRADRPRMILKFRTAFESGNVCTAGPPFATGGPDHLSDFLSDPGQRPWQPGQGRLVPASYRGSP